MKNNNYNLQLLHHSEIFATRDLALEYLREIYRPNSLDAEPVIVKYGNTLTPNVILAIGTSSESPGSFYAIDMAKTLEDVEEIRGEITNDEETIEHLSEMLLEIVDASGLTLVTHGNITEVEYQPDQRDELIGSAVTIAQAVDLISKYVQQEEELNIHVEDTDSIRMIYSVNQQGVKTLKGEIIVSTNGDSDDLSFNNNIIGVKNDGVYAATHLSYDDVRDEIVFTTSGNKNGRFQDDAIVQRVNLGKYVNNIIADNEEKTVKITVAKDGSTTKLSANLQIADRENNILKVGDGKVYVDGTARNIQYGEGTVADSLVDLENSVNALETSVENAAKSAHVEGGTTDTIVTQTSLLSDGGARVTGNVRLGSNNSIVVRDGGLSANITVDVDVPSNSLIVTIGNQTITKVLPGIELFQSAEYNDANEELIITFKTGNTLVIPIHNIIHTWEVENSVNSPVILTKTVVTGGTDKLSSDIKLRSTDNLIGKDNGQLFVSEANIDTKIAVETQRATLAEQGLQTNIDSLSNGIDDRFDAQDELIDNVTESVTTERERATAAENTIRETANTANTTANEAKTIANGAATGVSTLTTSLANETAARTNADTQLDGKITNEVSRATTAETALGTRIDNLTTQVSHDIDDAIHTASDDATTKANEAKNEAKTYSDTKVTEEKTRAMAAEQANTNAIATLTVEVDKKIEEVTVEKNSDLQYFINVDGVKVGEINIPEDQFFEGASYNPTTKVLTLRFRVISGGSMHYETVDINVSDLVDTYTAGDGLVVANNQFSVKRNNESENYLVVSNEGIGIFGINNALATKANAADVYTKTEIDNKGYLTEHQDISYLATKASLQETDDKATQNASDIADLTTVVNGMKFVTDETNTVRMTMDSQTGAQARTLTSDVKIKTISGGESANIIKSDANGIFATVTLNYNASTNTLSFNDGNGAKQIQLTGASFIEDATYDNVNKQIVLEIKQGDVTREITIPVGDLVDTLVADNKPNSPITITLEETANETKISANVSILNNAHNLLTNNNGSLFVDGDCNTHFATFGGEATTVQLALNQLKDKTDEIDGIKADIADLQDDVNTMKLEFNDIKHDFADMQGDFESLTELVNSFDERINEAMTHATNAENTVNELREQLGDISGEKTVAERLAAIERWIEEAIDFGTYNEGD